MLIYEVLRLIGCFRNRLGGQRSKNWPGYKMFLESGLSSFFCVDGHRIVLTLKLEFHSHHLQRRTNWHCAWYLSILDVNDDLQFLCVRIMQAHQRYYSCVSSCMICSYAFSVLLPLETRCNQLCDLYIAGFLRFWWLHRWCCVLDIDEYLSALESCHEWRSEHTLFNLQLHCNSGSSTYRPTALTRTSRWRIQRLATSVWDIWILQKTDIHHASFRMCWEDILDLVTRLQTWILDTWDPREKCILFVALGAYDAFSPGFHFWL